MPARGRPTRNQPSTRVRRRRRSWRGSGHGAPANRRSGCMPARAACRSGLRRGGIRVRAGSAVSSPACTLAERTCRALAGAWQRGSSRTPWCHRARTVDIPGFQPARHGTGGHRSVGEDCRTPVAAVPARLRRVGEGAAAELAEVTGADVRDAGCAQRFFALCRVLSGEDAVNQAGPERNLPPDRRLDIGRRLPERVASGDLLALSPVVGVPRRCQANAGVLNGSHWPGVTWTRLLKTSASMPRSRAWRRRGPGRAAPACGARCARRAARRG